MFFLVAAGQTVPNFYLGLGLSNLDAPRVDPTIRLYVYNVHLLAVRIEAINGLDPLVLFIPILNVKL